LSKDFSAKSKVKMKRKFVPWPSFADRMLDELNSKGKLCDPIIGDSHWIGGSAEAGHCVKLNDFFAKEGIKMCSRTWRWPAGRRSSCSSTALAARRRWSST
jgi:multiple sugar transport system substrate-binding protein